MTEYLPEGHLIDSPKNKSALSSLENLKEAQRNRTVLEAKASVCTAKHDLVVELGTIRGIIPKNEGAIGIETGETRDIALISRVGKPVCFIITDFEKDRNGNPVAICSRKAVQEECIENYLKNLVPGDIIPAVVTHMENFGCFADIGCGISSLLPIDSISVSRISHPSDRFKSGQEILAVVSGRDSSGRICLSHKELLGTWEENAARFSPGETVGGIIRSVEDYGVFVELAPNLAGLAESCSKLSAADGCLLGGVCSVGGVPAGGFSAEGSRGSSQPVTNSAKQSSSARIQNSFFIERLLSMVALFSL